MIHSSERTVKAVNIAFPEVKFENWSICERILPHAKVCMELIEKRNFELQEAARLLNEAGNYLIVRARFQEAKPFLEQSMNIRKNVLDVNHPDLAKTFNDFAILCQFQGKYKEAEELFDNALIIRKKILPEDNPHLAKTFNNLAYLYYVQDKFEEAEKLFDNALI